MLKHSINSLIIITAALCSVSMAIIDSEYEALKTFSVTLDKKLFEEGLIQNKMQIIYNIQLKPEQLTGSQVIGSISELNLNQSSNFEFHFFYKMHTNNSTIVIDIFARNKDSSPFSTNLVVVLDFLIAKFPFSYEIIKYDITSYQQHLQIKTNRSFELLFFLNGFINVSLSGYITHSYQSGDNIYTIHYMNKKDHSKPYYGFRQQVDYLNFTLVLAPTQTSIQKFRLTDKKYSVDYPKGWKYFYGMKGTTQQQFVGSFSQRAGGVKFQADNLGKDMTYGLVFLPIPNKNLIDVRTHNYQNTYHIIILSVVVGIVVAILLIVVFRKQLYIICFQDNKFEELTQLNRTSNISQCTKNDQKNRDISKQKYIINTVQEVDQRYQVSLRTSKNNSRKQPEVSLDD